MIRPASSSLISLALAALSLSANAVPDNVERGAEVFQNHCSRCHLPLEMDGRVRSVWAGRKADELFQRIKLTMPGEQPGSLPDSQYLDVTSYILNQGGVPLPEGDLKQQQLAELTIVPEEATTADKQDGMVNWAEFNGDLAASRYSPLDQINADNADSLEVAWEFNAGIFGPQPEFKNTTSPLAVDGTLYFTAGTTRNVVAIDAETAQLKWMWRPQEGKRFDDAPRKGSGRGVAYWKDGAQERIYTVTPGYYLVGLNAKTGLPDPSFGAGGWVDLQKGLRLAEDREDIDIGLSMPPLVVNDVIIVGAAHLVSFRPTSASNVKGDIRGFDARTGKLLWTFKTIPEPGEPGSETWLNGSEKFTGNAGVWAPMSADPELGLVYLPVESATGDRYGGDRPGNNLYANSLVALDIDTGEKRWHYQIIHHDIWDWDNPNAPILADLPNGRKVVVQLTKQSFAYVFDRETGEPVWPIVERPVPQTDVPGEWTSPTQPFPTKPAAYDRQGISHEDLIDFTPELFAEAKKAVKPYRLGPLYTPPSVANGPDGTKGTLSLPSATGGTNWEGGAFDPETGMMYVPSFTDVSMLALMHDAKASSVKYIWGGGGRVPKVRGLPLVKPPWGRITAIDLNSGDHRWWIPNGDTPGEVANHPDLKDVDLQRTGKPTRSGLLLTKSLLFAGEGWGGSPVFRAYDKKTGEIVAEIDLPATQAGQPVTYMSNGRQYVVMAVGDGKSAGRLVALALPE
ncbi:outer membrane protein assembly factor BamB family protein [Gilvimarinus sp. F26214L]|uniref:outer membrane protein assembly factor BamB family protein n=1 Tax=Gilvimarinus sp. DZF01 TaxID=3461371 RepID=UPI0040465276